MVHYGWMRKMGGGMGIKSRNGGREKEREKKAGEWRVEQGRRGENNEGRKDKDFTLYQ